LFLEASVSLETDPKMEETELRAALKIFSFDQLWVSFLRPER